MAGGVRPMLMLAALAACGQTADVVARSCVRPAGGSILPTGAVSVGIGSGGRVSTGVSLGMSASGGPARNPDAAYEACLARRAGLRIVRVTG